MKSALKNASLGLSIHVFNEISDIKIYFRLLWVENKHNIITKKNANKNISNKNNKCLVVLLSAVVSVK